MNLSPSFNMLRHRRPAHESDDVVSGSDTEVVSASLHPESTNGVGAREVRPRLVSIGGAEVICGRVGDEEHYFTLMCDTSENPYDRAPVFTLRHYTGSSELQIRSPIISGRNVSPTFVFDFLAVALSRIERSPEELSLNIHTAHLTKGQLEAAEEFGFGEISNHAPQPRATDFQDYVTHKQDELNRELQQAEGFLTSYLRGEIAEQTKPYSEWLRSAHALVKLTIIKEAKDGIEAARDHLEATNAHFDKALKTFPSEMAEVAVQALDVRSQIVYAGTLARLASCSDLAGYDIKEYKQLKGCSRNNELYNKSIAIYERLKESIDNTTSDRDKSLIKSGLAQALILYSEYLAQSEPERNGLGTVVDINRALRKRKRRGAQRRATDELKDAMKDINDKAILEELDKQLADINTSEHSLLEGVRDGEEMQMADKVLLAAA